MFTKLLWPLSKITYVRAREKLSFKNEMKLEMKAKCECVIIYVVNKHYPIAYLQLRVV